MRESELLGSDSNDAKYVETICCVSMGFLSHCPHALPWTPYSCDNTACVSPQRGGTLMTDFLTLTSASLRPASPAKPLFSFASDPGPAVVVLDVFAVTVRVIALLTGDMGSARQLATIAVVRSLNEENSGAVEVVVPRAIDLVLRRAAVLYDHGRLVSILPDLEQRLTLWRRLAVRPHDERSAIVMALLPMSAATISAALHQHTNWVTSAVSRWVEGIDPTPTDGQIGSHRAAHAWVSGEDNSEYSASLHSWFKET